MIRRPPRSTPLYSSAASDVYKRQDVVPTERPVIIAGTWGAKYPIPIPAAMARKIQSVRYRSRKESCFAGFSIDGHLFLCSEKFFKNCSSIFDQLWTFRHEQFAVTGLFILIRFAKIIAEQFRTADRTMAFGEFLHEFSDQRSCLLSGCIITHLRFSVFQANHHDCPSHRSTDIAGL